MGFNNVTFDVTGEIINEDNTVKEMNIAVLGSLQNDQQNYKIFNGMRGKIDDLSL